MAAIKFDDLARRLLSGGVWALVIKVASAGLSYAMFVLLARLLPADEYGRFAFGFSLAITFSLLISFGLPVAVLRFWPEYKARGETDLGRSFVARGFSLVWIGAVAAALIFLVLATWIAGRGTALVDPYFTAIAILMCLMAVSEYCASVLRADGSIVAALAPRDVVWRVGLIAVCTAFAATYLEFTAERALQAAWLCLAVVTVPQFLHAKRRLQVRRSDLQGRTTSAQWRRIALPMWGSAVLFGLVQQFDVVLLGMFMSPEQTGPYFAALRTAGLMGLLLVAGNMVAAPLISGLYHGGDDSALRRMCSLLIIAIAVPTLAGFAFIAVFGEWLLALFDPAFVSAYPLLVLLALGFTVTALAGPMPYFLQMVGKEREYLAISALVYAVVVVAQCILVPLYGAFGAAIPNAAGACLVAVWGVVLLRTRVGFDPSVVGLAWPANAKSRWRAAA